MTRLFEKADLLFGDESWENNGTRFPASFIRHFGELPIEHLSRSVPKTILACVWHGLCPFWCRREKILRRVLAPKLRFFILAPIVEFFTWCTMMLNVELLRGKEDSVQNSMRTLKDILGNGQPTTQCSHFDHSTSKDSK